MDVIIDVLSITCSLCMKYVRVSGCYHLQDLGDLQTELAEQSFGSSSRKHTKTRFTTVALQVRAGKVVCIRSALW